MNFIYGKPHFRNMEQAQEQCFLLTNGLGGYASQSIAASCNRSDHALLMAGIKAPAIRYQLLSRMDETIYIDDKPYEFSAQEYAGSKANKTGYRYLNSFAFEAYPSWNYQTEGVETEKSVIMEYGKNTVGLRYRIRNSMNQPVSVVCTPWMQFVKKGESVEAGQEYLVTQEEIKSKGITLYYHTNGELAYFDKKTISMYHGFDKRDGRSFVTKACANHSIIFHIPAKKEEECYIIYSMEKESPSIAALFRNETKRQQRLIERAGIKAETGKQLVRSADQFIVRRDSTDGMSIIAGYPFFTDWGRDTMIAMAGLCLSARRFEDAKSIFRSFMKYVRKGIMPNMFPESLEEPIYNTADASLLFIGAVYEYYDKTSDIEFIKEGYPVMEDIITWYKNGTDYHIRMDEDGLIEAGGELEQVTWMDIRFEDILPTRRHGKPVEINGYWYNSICIMAYFSGLLGETQKEQEFLQLKELIRESFQAKFFNPKTGCLKDVLSGGPDENQIRCNQIFAAALPFSPLSESQARSVVEKVYEELYTPIGLRTLSRKDKEYHGKCCGNQYERDMAYHQGTVWPFPLGSYYLAYLKVHGYEERAVKRVKEQLKALDAYLFEGCVGQIAEIYDGDAPDTSRGCFAQAWSVGELLRVYEMLENVRQEE